MGQPLGQPGCPRRLKPGDVRVQVLVVTTLGGTYQALRAPRHGHEADSQDRASNGSGTERAVYAGRSFTRITTGRRPTVRRGHGPRVRSVAACLSSDRRGRS